MRYTRNIGPAQKTLTKQCCLSVSYSDSFLIGSITFRVTIVTWTMVIWAHPVFSYPFLISRHPGDYRCGVLRYLVCFVAYNTCFPAIYTSDHALLTISFFSPLSLSIQEGTNTGRSFGSTLFNDSPHLSMSHCHCANIGGPNKKYDKFFLCFHALGSASCSSRELRYYWEMLAHFTFNIS